ncbi:MAG: hypothetical protein EHM81_14390, partial [Chloroflexi bacterium]
MFNRKSITMNLRVLPRLLLMFGIILIGIACNFLSQIPYSPTKRSFTDPCATKPDLGLNLEAAASAITVTSTKNNSPPNFGTLGIEGARRLADEIRPTDTFCSLTVSPSTQAVLEQADQLIKDGKAKEAQTLLENWLAEQEKPENGNALHLAAEGITDSDRQILRDVFRAAEKVYDTGGNPQPFVDYATEIFRSMATQ